MMNQQYTFPGRSERRFGCGDRSLYRAQGGPGRAGLSCGCGLGGHLPSNRDMRPNGRNSSCSGTREMPCDRSLITGGQTGCGCQGNNQIGRSSEVGRCHRRGDGAHTGCGCHSGSTNTGNADSCGCNNTEEINACDVRKLMDQIRAVDFALYEVILYLDVYPHSCDALETYHKLKKQHEELHHAYEASAGPLTAFGNESTTAWDWMKKPFPWECDAE